MNTPSQDAFHAEFDYLWQAVKDAQDGEARLQAERARAKDGLEHASSRVMHLENELAKAVERERLLRAEAEKFKAEALQRARELDNAARQAETVRAAAEMSEGFEKRLLRKDGETSVLDAEVARLQAETSVLRETLKGRDASLQALKQKLDGLAALPEISRTVEADSLASGQPPSVYAHLLHRIEKEKTEAARTALDLDAAREQLAKAGAAASAAQRETEELRSSLALRAGELESLQAALKEAAARNSISSAEIAALEERAVELRSALAQRETALERAAAEAAALRRDLDSARAETARLREEAAAQVLKTEEQKNNFAAAVAQVFDLQKRAAALKTDLTAAHDQNSALAAEAAARAADLQKVSGLLQEAKNGLAQEKETGRRAAGRINVLEAEIESLKAKIAAAGDYSAKLLRAVQERDLALDAVKTDLRKTEALEMENEDLRRRNVKFSGLLRREQSDFTARVITALERAAKDLKTFNLRIPAAERKGLEPALKNLLASVNLMKGWQEYMDPETPELADTDLSGFFSGEAGKWERAFKQRKLSISYAVATPRLRARLHAESMKMLFYHLAKNAYEHLPGGGSLRITLKASEDGRQAVLSFEDTGPGFTQETLNKLFAPFNTSEKGKTGIGLAVANRIAEKHGGTLSAANKKDRGTLVEVRLPLGS
ncbi:MAG: ATP-binding protein [Elusimicrobiales bacterium]|nr:ATP-binding protein [Elusimicrobiales bacterium]